MSNNGLLDRRRQRFLSWMRLSIPMTEDSRPDTSLWDGYSPVCSYFARHRLKRRAIRLDSGRCAPAAGGTFLDEVDRTVQVLQPRGVRVCSPGDSKLMGAFVNSRRKLGNDVTRSVNRDLFIRYTLLCPSRIYRNPDIKTGPIIRKQTKKSGGSSCITHRHSIPPPRLAGGSALSERVAESDC